MDSRASFVHRLAATAGVVGSVNALAKKAGVSQTGLRNYLLTSEPTRPVLEKVAAAAGVAPQWLILGLGPMCGADSEVAARARVALQKVWISSNSARREKREPWAQFLERFRAGKAKDVPTWVAYALSAELKTDGNDGSGDQSGSLGETTPFNANDPAMVKLLSVFCSELVRWKTRVEADPVSLTKVEQAAAIAFEQLVAIVRADGRRPATSTIRTLLEANIFQLDSRLSPDEEGDGSTAS